MIHTVHVYIIHIHGNIIALVRERKKTIGNEIDSMLVLLLAFVYEQVSNTREYKRQQNKKSLAQAEAFIPRSIEIRISPQ